MVFGRKVKQTFWVFKTNAQLFIQYLSNNYYTLVNYKMFYESFIYSLCIMGKNLLILRSQIETGCPFSIK